MDGSKSNPECSTPSPDKDLAWYRTGQLTATQFASGAMSEIAELKAITLSADEKITVGDFR